MSAVVAVAGEVDERDVTEKEKTKATRGATIVYAEKTVTNRPTHGAE